MPLGIQGLFRGPSGGPQFNWVSTKCNRQYPPLLRNASSLEATTQRDMQVPNAALPQQSEKSWALGTWDSGTGQPKVKSLGVNGQVGASCLSSRMVWLGIEVLYRKLVTEDGVAVGGRSWGVTLEAWPCRLQSRDPLGTRVIPFISTSAFESCPPSSGGLGEGRDSNCFEYLLLPVNLSLHSLCNIL